MGGAEGQVMGEMRHYVGEGMDEIACGRKNERDRKWERKGEINVRERMGDRKWEKKKGEIKCGRRKRAK